jgi:cytoskeletal protein CcmA (bactofilin family)
METRIDATARLKGALVTEDDLVLEGVIEGTVRSTALVCVAVSATVRGDVTGREVRVAGTVEGNVLASALFVLHTTGKVHGDVRAAHIQVEDGGVLSGKVITEAPGGFVTRAMS